MAQITKLVLLILVVLLGLVLCSVYGQGPPPPGGVRFPGGNGGASGNDDLSLSKKVIQVVAKHFERKLPNINTETVVTKVKSELGLSPGKK